MGFYADLHVHSRYSRATSRDADLEHMSLWARKKGVTVVGTGDFTHPEWFSEIEEKLVPAEPGLFRLRSEIEREVEGLLAGDSGVPTRFMLEVEISTIYKKDDRTRKVHHLIYAPDLASASRFRQRLERIGNIASDGRPILGLDSRDLLEITLESGDGCYLVPAHIWTPWFAALGSKSGFDTIEHCYGDLAGEIFAVETGLSSDPPMNRRLSRLDRFTLVSNSDAHSPPKIGREACVFDTDLDYGAMRRALETGEGYDGTVEFFAEEGKYHLDGHRKCGVRSTPDETRARDGLCPECGKPLTLGVMHRIDELADRETAPGAGDECRYRSLIPLEEVIAETERVGPKSKRVQKSYETMVARLGPELSILERVELDEVQRASSSLVAEALSRMRTGRVIREAGFDGQYGVIRLFERDELDRAAGSVFDFMRDVPVSGAPCPTLPSSSPPCSSSSSSSSSTPTPTPTPTPIPTPSSIDSHLDAAQLAAVSMLDGPVAIIAGPGTGKTRTLACRIARIARDRDAPHLAITFTRRAAGELSARVARLLGGEAEVTVTTFHAFGLSILREHASRVGLEGPVRVAGEQERREVLRDALGSAASVTERLLSAISRCKRGGDAPAGETARAYELYQAALRSRGLVDFDDLTSLAVRLLEDDATVAGEYRARYPWISVDEFQDIDPVELRLLELLAAPDGNICVIGDPDQSIYGFRGAESRCFDRFGESFPDARVASLNRNYRSSRVIVDASLQLIAPRSRVADRRLEACDEERGLPTHVEMHDCRSDRAEAELVVHTIERLIGGSAFFSIDSGRVDADDALGDGALSFGDFAVLHRAQALATPLVEAFQRSGMPYQQRSHEALADATAVRAVLAAIDAMNTDDATPLSEALDAAARVVRSDEPDVDRFLPALRALAERVDDDHERFRAELSLGVDVDFWDPRAEAVSLLTLHAAKGLEFPVVFIVGCEDGILPLRWGAATEEEEAEERRLFFVGMTRARERLVLTRARERSWRGAVRPMEPSPFLADIEEGLLALHEHRRKAGPRFRQLELFDGA